MRSKRDYSVRAGDVHSRATAVVQDHLRLADYSSKCTASIVLSILFFAASRVRSIHDACGRLRNVPGDDTVRDALVATLPEMPRLQKRLNAALADDLPKALRKRRQILAIDLTLIPYHGEFHRDPKEVYRSQAKSGTTHFHAYASCYVVRHGHRLTIAMSFVPAKTKMEDVVKGLLRQAGRVGVKPRLVLLDRGFYSVGVIRYLQSARYPFLMPAVQRGRKPKDPSQATGIRALAARKKSGWSTHTLTDARGKRKATVRICVSCRNYAGRWKRHGRQTLVYAFWGFNPGSHRWVREVYRKRFGIESSYRQMNQVRIRTSTRNPLHRLLFAGLALILRNVWVWFHLNVFAKWTGGRLDLHLEQLRLGTLGLCLQRVAEALFGCSEYDQVKLQI